MKTFFGVILLFLPFVGVAQDTAITISASMFNKMSDQVHLSNLDGWLFKKGNDTAWAKKDLDIGKWEKLKPTEISAKYADKNGKAEGWFRIKIRPDNTLDGRQLGFRWVTWAAGDIYINGAHFLSFGNTGSNGKPYIENRIAERFWPVSLNLKAGVEYTIAVHFVDYQSPFPPGRLKSEESVYSFMFSITGPECTNLISGYRLSGFIYNTIWISVCVVLSILFWLLSTQNPAEKELRLIAVCSVFFVLVTWFFQRVNLADVSFVGFSVSVYVLNLMTKFILIIIPVILANVFKRKISQRFKILLIAIALFSVVDRFIPSVGIIVVTATDLFLTGVCIYYIASSWRSLRGAQWSVVAGLFATLLFFSSEVVNGFITDGGDGESVDLQLYLATGFLLCFPLSLLVYVATRFKEIIKEVQQNARQIIHLSEEKKQQALNQQKVLQDEVNRQTLEIRTTLNHLKATQSQLIQSEKMASLGELTAGIAHEILAVFFME